MSKIILNECYGGYGWSVPGIYAYLQAKGYKDIKFLTKIYPQPGVDKEIELGKEEFFRINERRKNDTHCGPNGEYVSELYLATEDGCYWHQFSVPREDDTAIAILEEYGSEFCSDDNAELCVEEYDEDLFVAKIDEYDGVETLDLVPRITEARIRACENMDEVVKLLKKCNVFVNQ